MRVGRFEWQPHPVLSVATLLIVSGCIRLGFWQLDRSQEKLRITQRIEARMAQPPLELKAALPRASDEQYRRVKVSGEFVPSPQILLDNQIRAGRPGYDVITPFKIAASDSYLLVNRGWTPLGLDRNVQPRVPLPAGTLTLEGRLDFPTARPFGMQVPDDTAWTWRWPYLDLPRFRQQTGLDPGAYIVLQGSATADGLLRAWPVPADRGQRHSAYALQWFAFALIGIGVYLKLTLRSADDAGPRE